MAKVIVRPEKYIDPESPEAIESARIKADTAKAKVDLGEGKALRDEQIRIDTETIAAEKKETERQAAEIKKKQDEKREAELKKPLSDDEMAEYRAILVQSRSGKQVDVTSMRMLGDYRIRLKNKGVKNPE